MVTWQPSAHLLNLQNPECRTTYLNRKMALAMSRVGNLRLRSSMPFFSSSEVALSRFNKMWNFNLHVITITIELS